MRYDEINILGEFKINGLTASPGQALGLSGSEFTWITVSSTSVDALGLTGTDYVICQSVNTGNPATDAITNGNRLKSAYATASALYVSNRVSVLITPGDYDLGGEQLYLTTNNVDLIGLSSDASDVILRGSGPYVLQIIDAFIDTALCNVTIDGTSAAYYSVDNAESAGCYLRWNNVIATGNMFTNDDNGTYNDLNGEFKNIKVHDSQYAFYIYSGNLSGIYENIELINANYAFSTTGNLSGTYSNIKSSGTNYSFVQSGGDLSGTFENIKLGDGNDIFIGGVKISANFRNIEVGNISASIFLSFDTLDGTFHNIKVGNVANQIFSTTNNLSGTFSNIEIGNVLNLFNSFTPGNILGSFEDITVGNATNIFVSYDISGTFKNITTGNISNCMFLVQQDILGTFDNIETGNIGNSFCYSYQNGDTNNINGTFSNIKIGNLDTLAFRAYDVIGYFENISGVNVDSVFASSNVLDGYFKNITFDEVTGSIFGCAGDIDGMNGVYDSISFGGNATNAFTSLSNYLTGTYSNIQMGNAVDVFRSNISLTGTYENIKIGTCSSAFISTTSDINGYFDTIEIGGVSSGGSFVAGSSLYGTYKNINIGDATGQTLFDSVSYTDGVFENIEIRDCANFFNVANVNLSGTFSNIRGGNISSSAFTPGALNLTGYYKDITLGTVGNFMGASTILSNTVIDNLKVNAGISVPFAGKIINSFIDARGLSQPAIIITDDTIVERSKFLSDSGYCSISSPGEISALISFTITNYGITSSITNNILPADPLNIDNSNIT